MVEDEPDDGRWRPEAVGMMVTAWLQDHFYLSMHFLVPLGKNLQVLFVWNSRVTVPGDPDDWYLCFSYRLQVVARIAFETSHVVFAEIPFGEEIVPQLLLFSARPALNIADRGIEVKA